LNFVFGKEEAKMVDITKRAGWMVIAVVAVVLFSLFIGDPESREGGE